MKLRITGSADESGRIAQLTAAMRPYFKKPRLKQTVKDGLTHVYVTETTVTNALKSDDFGKNT